MSVDPFIQNPSNTQSINPYSYIMNNPMAGTDPSGYACTTVLKMNGDCGSGGGLSGGADITTGYDEDRELSNLTEYVSQMNGQTNDRNSFAKPGQELTKLDGNSANNTSEVTEQDSGWGFWDTVQTGLDIVGLIPIVGEVADLANAGISVARGNYGDAAISIAATIPFVGNAATAGKYAGGVISARKSADQLGREGEAAASAITGVAKNTQKFPVNGRTRIPDQVNASSIATKNPLHVTEVKNVKSQSFTRQLRDNVDLVGGVGGGGRVDVFVRSNTKVTGPLQKAHDNPLNPINIRREL